MWQEIETTHYEGDVRNMKREDEDLNSELNILWRRWRVQEEYYESTKRINGMIDIKLNELVVVKFE